MSDHGNLKTSAASIRRMFVQRYDLGMRVADIAADHQICFGYCSRILTAKARQEITGALLGKYRPSWGAMRRYVLTDEEGDKHVEIAGSMIEAIRASGRTDLTGVKSEPIRQRVQAL